MVTAWQNMSKNGYPTFANGSKWLDWSQGGQGVIINGNLTFSTINRTQCDFWDAIQTVTSSNPTANNTSVTMASVTVVTTATAASYNGSTTGFVLATFFVLLRM
jgi:hypothetical protein